MELRKSVNFPLITLLILILTIISIYYIGYSKYPVFHGDVTHHIWRTGEIIDTGENPLEPRVEPWFDLYYFFPLFNILTAIISSISGTNIIFTMQLINYAMIILYAFSIYILAYKVFKSEICGILSSFLVLTIGNLNEVDRWLPAKFYFIQVRPQDFTLILLILLFFTIIKYISDKKIGTLAVAFILMQSIMFYHHFTAFFAIVLLVTLCIIYYINFRETRREMRHIASILVFSILIFVFVTFGGIAGENLFEAKYHKTFSFSEESTGDFTKMYGSGYNILSLQNLLGNFLIIYISIGLLILFRNKFDFKKENMAFLFSWLLLSLYLGFAYLGDFYFSPDRFIILSIFPLAMLAGFGIYQISYKFKKIFIFIIFGLVIFNLIPMINNFNEANLGMDDKQLEPFLWARENIRNTTVIVDPYYGDLFTRLSGVRLTYTYLPGKLNWEEPSWNDIGNLSIQETVCNGKTESKIDYIIITSLGKSLCQDFKLPGKYEVKKVYSSQYISIYKILK